MRFYSNRNHDVSVSLHQAIDDGLAKDGGLYIPESFPEACLDLQQHYMTFAYQCLQAYFQADELQDHLEAICNKTFTFAVPLKKLSEKIALLELFHGPTLSFKDFGARFLANTMQHIPHDKPRVILVATSGDTGSAVAAAFNGRKDSYVCILYPKDMVSSRQEKQLNCWGDNIITCCVSGTFDQCQSMVKQSFQDEQLHQLFDLTTSNSINIGRLLPQITYYAYASLQAQHNQQPFHIIVPSGNIGNVTAAFWAKHMGYPIGDIVLAHNKNRPLLDYLQTGSYKPHATQASIANAMDVGNPSNFSRLQTLYPHIEDFRQHVTAYSFDDDAIKQAIRNAYETYQVVLCPHTAAAYAALTKVDHTKPWTIAATAHPAKFENIIEPLLDITCEIPPSLQKHLDNAKQPHHIEADYGALKNMFVSLKQKI